MLKILFTVLPAAGHLHPTIPIALALQQAGHEVHYLTGQSRIPLLNSLGLPATAILPGRADTAAQILMPVEAHRDTYNPFRIFTQIRFLLDLMIDALVEMQRSAEPWSPDILVADFSTPVGGVLARRLGIPWLSVAIVPACIRTRTGTPIFLGGLCRPRHWGHHLRDWAGRQLHELLRASLITLFAGRFQRLGIQLNLPNGGDGLYSPYAILGTAAPEIEYPRDWPPQMHWIGPVDWSDAPPLSADVRAFWDTTEPKLFATLGTEQFEEKEARLTLLAETLETLPYRSIVGCGGNVQLPQDRYQRVLITPYVRYDQILSLADLVIHHGGAGILYSTLLAGKPALVVPQGKDQFDNAQRVQDASLGLRLDGRKLTAPKLSAALAHLHNDPKFITSARELAEQLRHYDPIPQAVSLIEQIARQYPARPRPQRLFPHCLCDETTP